MRLRLMVNINSPGFRLLGYPHLYYHGSNVEISKLSKCTLSEIDVLGPFGASSACVNNSDKDAFVLSAFTYCDG
jgi:hypothetical protein